MSTLTIAIVVAFVCGYLCIALESLTKINKAAIALLMCVCCWTLLMMGPAGFYPEVASNEIVHHISEVIEHHLGDAAGTLFFLMGAMTIVEIVDTNGGFNFVRDALKTRSKRKLMWRVAFMTFFLSAILDNLTTSIVMIMVLRKLVQSREERLIYAGLIIISANSGGAFSPIGDVTTIMLWIKGVITTQGVLTEIFVPSLVSMIIPAAILSLSLKGKFDKEQNLKCSEVTAFTKNQRKVIFLLGVGGLIFVPIFKTITHLPPFMGILLVLGVLWTVTEIFHRQLEQNEDDTMAKRVSDLLSKIDLSTIMFFLGILMAVAVLQEIGILTSMGEGLNEAFAGNYYPREWYRGRRHGRRRHLLATAGLLCRRGRFHAHHWQRRRRCCHGSREDHLRMVSEEDDLDCFCRLSGRYRLLLGRETIHVILLSKLTRFSSRLEFKLRREIVWRFEIESVGYFFYAQIRRTQQFLCTLQAQLLLIGSRRQSCMLLEQFAEVRIANPQLLGHLLNGQRALQRLTYTQTSTVHHIHMRLVSTLQLDITLQGIHHSNQVIHQSSQQLLSVGSLFLGSLISHTAVHVLPFETNPITLPSLLTRRMIAMPFAREE